MPAPNTINIPQLSRLIGLPDAPVIVDSRVDEHRSRCSRTLPGAVRKHHETASTWAAEFRGRRVAVVCQRGEKLSQGAAAWLRHEGVQAETLDGGFEGWVAAGGALVRPEMVPPRDDKGRTVWVTRARPKMALAILGYIRWSALALAASLPAVCWGARAADRSPLVLEATIPLENTGGRIDHMAVDLRRQRLFVAELGNGTVDVVDLAGRKVVARIGGLNEPQGVGYSEKADLVVVASAGDGSVRFYRGEDMAPAGVVPLGDDADNVRIDPRNGNVAVGYGSGGLAVIDPMTRAKFANVRLPGHPEGFQLDPGTGRAYVNVPDARQVAVVDLGSATTTTWRVPGAHGNFPMAYDPERREVAIVARIPPELLVLDAGTGQIKARQTACGDADDVFFDRRRQRLYVSCGSGEVATWQRSGSAFQSMPPTRTDRGARTSLFVPEMDRLFVAKRAGLLGSRSAILVFRPEAVTD